MYSVVVMMALSGSADTPEFGRWRCGGCWGGCFGGRLIGWRFRCYGCIGGYRCYGYGGYRCYGGCFGCYGGCYSYYGGYSYSGCYGSNGCYGSYYGYVPASPPAAMTYYYPASPSYAPVVSSSIQPAVPRYRPVGASPSYAPVVTTSIQPAVPRYRPVANSNLQNVNYQAPTPSPAGANSGDATAMVVVTLPADARLTFNGWTSTNNSSTRRFRTPALVPGKDYVYTLRAELVRAGQTLVQSQQVLVRAGQETRVPFEFTTAASLSQKQ